MTACLGRRIAELADGRLSGPERERALAHVSACASCRGALDSQREARQRLAEASAPAVPADLMARLRAVPHDVPRADALPPVIDLAVARRRHRRRAVMAGGAALVSAVAIVGGTATLSQTAAAAPSVVPNLHSYAVEHAALTGEVSPDSFPVQSDRPMVERASFDSAP